MPLPRAKHQELDELARRYQEAARLYRYPRFRGKGTQFPTGEMDPENPSVVLLDAKQERVIGLEWEAKDVGQGDMEMFGVPIKLQQGHPGVPDPHYMLHIYFKSDGKVRMMGQDPPFDPDVMCPAMPDTGAGGLASGASIPVGNAVAGLTMLIGAGYAVVRRR